MEYLVRAREALSACEDVALLVQSPVYETAPAGVREEYADLPYLNAVLIIESNLSPERLLEVIHEIEHRLGRVRTEDRFAPRTIDIDILYSGDVFTETETLTLPHPRWADRRFVLQPLADVRPELVLPGANQTVRDLLSALDDPLGVTRYRNSW